MLSIPVDPDETLRSATSHLGLNCLLRPVCPNTYGKYGSQIALFKFLDKYQYSKELTPCHAE